MTPVNETRKKIIYIAQAGVVAALYTVLTIIAAGFDLASGAIQVRLVPPIVSNMLIIPFILTYAYHIPGGIPYFMVTVGIGEMISCMVLGQILLTALKPFKGRVFRMDEE